MVLGILCFIGGLVLGLVILVYILNELGKAVYRR